MFRYLLLLTLLIGGTQAWSQAIPAATGPSKAVFLGISGGTTGSNYRDGVADKAIGGLIGGYYQTPGLFGVEVRAGGLKVKAFYPEFFVVGGLRVSKTYGKLKPYVFAGGGEARGRYSFNGAAILHYGVALQGALGADYSFDRFDWRIADFSVQRSSNSGSAMPLMLTTGLVYHF